MLNIFFFVYLQERYGNNNITPTDNWVSSTRRKIYPHYLRNIDDSIGYDFFLHDRHEIFVQGFGSRTKRCYFEVKGTSGSFCPERTRFNISENEFKMCQSITQNQRRCENEAYFIVIVEYCLDEEKIFFGCHY